MKTISPLPGQAWLPALLLLTAALAGCDKPRSIGDPNQILVAAPQPVWAVIEEDIKAALEPTTFTVTNERVFDVGYIDLEDPSWATLRYRRQVLLIGSAAEAPIAEAIAAHRGDPPPAPAVIQARNVWAQNQLVTVVLLPDSAPVSVAGPLLTEVGQVYLSQFEEYARSRMFVTRANEELAAALRREAGFALTLPNVYRHEEVEPGVYVFRNDMPDPSRLIRNITVASRPRDEFEMAPEAAIAWRADLAGRLENPPQVTEAQPGSHQVETAAGSALQVHGTWSNPPGEWPAAGPFITRMIACGDRVFLVDAWLYAPGISKYEYMYQLHTILNSFECAAGA